MKRQVFSLLFALIAGAAFAGNPVITAKDFVALTKSDKNLVIIDAGTADNYKTSHVTNAVNIPHKTLYKDGEPEGIIKSPEELAAIFGAKGVSDNSTIVIYDEGSQKYSSRVYWILKYLGAENVRILHKDMNEWKKVRVPITRMPARAKKTTFTPKVNPAVLATFDQVKAKADKAGVKLIDVRTPEEFNGTSEKPVSPGHIPGSMNINYTEFLTSSKSFKSKEELAKLVSEKGIQPEDEIIVFCKTSVRGAVAWIALHDILGYRNVKLYDGALAEWEHKGQPIEK